MIEQMFAALSRSAASGSKTTALAPLHMVLALVLGAFLVSLGLQAPEWARILFGGFCGIVVVLEVCAYVYLLVYDRDALRSERFTIEKMRIERGLLGDTSTGFRELAPGESILRLPAGPEEQDRA